MAIILVIGAADSHDLKRWAEALDNSGHRVHRILNSADDHFECGIGGCDIALADSTVSPSSLAELLQSPLIMPQRTTLVAVANHAGDMPWTALASLCFTLNADSPVNGHIPVPSLRTGGQRLDGECTKHYAAARWANALVALVPHYQDARTIGAWGHAIGASAGAIRNWCRGVKASPRRSLILARLLRAVFQSAGHPWQPERHLDVTDERTLRKMLAGGGLPRAADRVYLGELLLTQVLFNDDWAIDALRAALVQTGKLASGTKRTADRAGDLG